MQSISLFQDKGDHNPYSLRTTPDVDAAANSPDPTPVMPVTSTASTSKVKSKNTFSTPSQASTLRSRMLLKSTLQDAFANGTVKENLILEHLGAQNHEHAIHELELKHCKLENQAIKKQHQRKHECEQHEFCMLQMWMMMSQGQQGAAATQLPVMTQANGQPLFNGYGLMAELNADSLPSENPSNSGSYLI